MVRRRTIDSRMVPVSGRGFIRSIILPAGLILLSSSLVLAQSAARRTTELRDILREAQAELRRGELQSAFAKFRAGVRLSQLARSRAGEGSAFAGLGAVYHWQGDYSQALQYYGQALEIIREVGDRKVEGGLLESLGIARQVQGNYPQALEHYDEAIRICSRNIQSVPERLQYLIMSAPSTSLRVSMTGPLRIISRRSKSCVKSATAAARGRH